MSRDLLTSILLCASLFSTSCVSPSGRQSIILVDSTRQPSEELSPEEDASLARLRRIAREENRQAFWAGFGEFALTAALLGGSIWLGHELYHQDHDGYHNRRHKRSH